MPRFTGVSSPQAGPTPMEGDSALSSMRVPRLRSGEFAMDATNWASLPGFGFIRRGGWNSPSTPKAAVQNRRPVCESRGPKPREAQSEIPRITAGRVAYSLVHGKPASANSGEGLTDERHTSPTPGLRSPRRREMTEAARRGGTTVPRDSGSPYIGATESVVDDTTLESGRKISVRRRQWEGKHDERRTESPRSQSHAPSEKERGRGAPSSAPSFSPRRGIPNGTCAAPESPSEAILQVDEVCAEFVQDQAKYAEEANQVAILRWRHAHRR